MAAHLGPCSGGQLARSLRRGWLPLSPGTERGVRCRRYCRSLCRAAWSRGRWLACLLPCCLTPPAVVVRRPPCPVTTAGRPPRNKGRRYPADPPTVEEIVAVMRCAGITPHGLRVRALVVIL